MRNPSSRAEEYIAGSQNEVIALAEAKLGRSLTPREQAGIRNFRSTMRLECFIMSFSHAATTPDDVLRDLEYFIRISETTSGSQ